MSIEGIHAQGLPPSALAGLLGVEVVERGPGRATLRATVASDHLNAHGTAHGGFTFTLADEALAIAGNSHGPVAFALVTSIHFTSPARKGDVLMAEAREVSLGRSTGTYEVVVTAGDRTIAIFTGTVHRRTTQ